MGKKIWASLGREAESRLPTALFRHSWRPWGQGGCTCINMYAARRLRSGKGACNIAQEGVHVDLLVGNASSRIGQSAIRLST